MINKFSFEQFSDEINYDIDFEIGNTDKFQDLYFHELDVQILLNNINSGKAAACWPRDGIDGAIFKNCAVSLAWLNHLQSYLTFSLLLDVYLKNVSYLLLSQSIKNMKRGVFKIVGQFLLHL